MPGTVVFLGAGASKACGGPLTSEILPNMLRGNAAAAPAAPHPAGRVNLIKDFLTDQFHVTPASPDDHYPGMPLLMSLIDTALERRQTFHPAWDLGRISDLREAMEFGIFDHLEERLQKAPTNSFWQLFDRLFVGADEPQVISTNYDVIADTAMMFLSELRTPDGGRFPDYRCQISSDFYRNEPHRFGRLLKLHGSLNWLYCRTCARLEIGASESRRYLKVLGKMLGPSLETFYSADGAPCAICQTKLRPLLIAPTHLKNYRNPHIAQVWYEAEQVLRNASRVVIVGYSLPDDDVEVVYLLKRSLAHLAPAKIMIVEFNKNNPAVPLFDHPVGRRYRTLFGDGIQWHATGLDACLASGAIAPG
jgi:hypothetical protein